MADTQTRGMAVICTRRRTPVDGPTPLYKQDVRGSIPLSSTEDRWFRQLMTFEHSTLGSQR
jgi:hypothetical protein